MMHHPNMHHQPMSGHPPQHLTGPQGMPAHHQMPPHQIHRENRHVPMHRVGMGGGGPLGSMVHGQRPHAVRPLHHPPPHHHSVPPPLKAMRRGYGPGYPGVLYPPPRHHVPHNNTHAAGLGKPSSPIKESTKLDFEFGVRPPSPSRSAAPPVPSGATSVATSVAGGEGEAEGEARAEGDAALSTPSLANSKEKTPMCLVNELARYNKIKHQYRLTSETGPAHKKIFTVTLRLGDTEEYTAEGSSIKRAQHGAAALALAGTGLSAPPARPAAPHGTRPGHSVMPTVELNALAMKMCQPAVYTSVGAVAGARWGRSASLLYRVRVAVGGRAWLGEGNTPQGARHDAAARALHDLRPAPPPTADTGPAAAPAAADDTPVSVENGAEELSSEVKSPVSLVHELALKRNLTVGFSVKSERGPPHMRVFVTVCTVGDMETEGEGNGKKVSKRRAAEKMLDEMKARWPPALLRPRPPPLSKRKHQPTKKKPRNLIKENEPATSTSPAGDNPISRLAMACQAVRARSPQYALLEERGAARRREFRVQCTAHPHVATGAGPNKKTAKRRAAHNVLLAMELGSAPPADSTTDTTNNNTTTNNNNTDTKRKEECGTESSEARQPVPGVLLMDYHQRATPHNNTAPADPSPGAKDQLMYLSQLLGFTVQFSDFPKRNHGEYLSLVSLSTTPPVMVHGGGPSTASSHEQCARAALAALASMGLDTTEETQKMSSASPALSNGVSE